MRIAVFASGDGSNFEAICQAGIPVSLLVTNQPEARAVRRAERLGVPAVVVRPADYEDRDAFERAIIAQLQEQRIDLVALAGYMRIVGPVLLEAYPGRIVNIHPSLLPAFPGKGAIAAALAAGVAETGVTVHYIDEGIDTGPVLAQRTVAVAKGITLAELEERVHAVEHQLYPEVLAQLEGA